MPTIAEAQARYEEKNNPVMFNNLMRLLGGDETAAALLYGTALEICGHPDFVSTHARLGVFCGSLPVVPHLREITEYLQLFEEWGDHTIVDTMRSIAHSLMHSHQAQNALGGALTRSSQLDTASIYYLFDVADEAVIAAQNLLRGNDEYAHITIDSLLLTLCLCLNQLKTERDWTFDKITFNYKRW